MLAKGVVRDVARVGGYPPGVGSALAGMIPDEPNITLSAAWEKNPELRAFVEADAGYQKLWNIALKLEGTKKSAGVHACGHIPTPSPCEELFPCRVDSDGYLVCQYNMEDAEHLGNLKKDLLMLRNLTIIDTAMKAVKERYGVSIPLWTEEILNDKEALAMIAAGDTNGVFQLESEGMKGFMKNLKPSCFEDIIAGVSLYRPGPMDYIPAYIQGKQHPESIKYLVPELKPILEPTYGQIVYQEQVMKIVRDLAGFTMGRADVVRKAMSKKREAVMEEERIKFVHGYHKNGLDIPGCIENGISKDTAETIYGQMKDFAKYAFNKSHAAAYAAVSMQTAYLKAHYPLEFASGLLTSVMDNQEKLAVYVSEYRQKGYEILAPNVNTSGIEFRPDGGSLCYGLFSIKNVGGDVIAGIIKERDENGLYKSFPDFLKRCWSFGKRAIEYLIKAGALDFCGLTRRTMLENLERLVDSYKKEQKRQVEGQMSLFDLFDDESEDRKEFDQSQIVDLPEYDKIELLNMEKESTGFYITGHPLDPYTDVLRMKYHVCSNRWFIPSEDSGEYQLNPDEEVVIAGVVTENRVLYTKKDSKPMSIITVEDAICPVRAVLFPNVWEVYGNVPQKNTLVVVKGKVKIDDRGISVIVSMVFQLNKLPQDLYIKFDTYTEYERATPALMSLMSEHSGNPDSRIKPPSSIIIYANGVPRPFPLPGSKHQVCVDEDIIKQAQKMFGEWNVRTKDFHWFY